MFTLSKATNAILREHMSRAKVGIPRAVAATPAGSIWRRFATADARQIAVAATSESAALVMTPRTVSAIALKPNPTGA